MNIEKLRMATRENKVEADVFYFDPKIINWEDYFINTHIPGVVKYVFKWQPQEHAICDVWDEFVLTPQEYLYF